MRFGLLCSAQADGRELGPGTGQGFRDYLDFNVEAEALGLHSSFLVEHHFTGWNQVSSTLEDRLLHFSKPKLLIVDELGYLPFEPNAAHLFFQLVSRRYERGSMLVTSNRAVGEWGSVFGDAIVATAILDRLLHHSRVVTIRGDSYRLREKHRSGLFKAPVVADSAAAPA